MNAENSSSSKRGPLKRLALLMLLMVFAPIAAVSWVLRTFGNLAADAADWIDVRGNRALQLVDARFGVLRYPQARRRGKGGGSRT